MRGGAVRVLDQSRQWPTPEGPITAHHFKRYDFAAKHSSGRILDAACGAGYGSQILWLGGKEVVGVDYSADAVAWARANFPGPTYIQGKIEDSPWEGQFQTVVSLETIEHIQDPKPALKAFRRACVGELIASVPNQDNYPFKAEKFAGDESPHYRHYRPQEFQELLEECGFRVIERFCQISKGKPEVQGGTDGMFLIYVCV